MSKKIRYWKPKNLSNKALSEVKKILGKFPEYDTRKESAIRVLFETGRSLYKRLLATDKALKFDSEYYRRKKLTMIKKEIDWVNSGIENLVKHKYRPSAKALALFEDAYNWSYEDRDYGQVMDKNTNFKRLLLEELANQGVNIYNPSELNKVLKGYSLDQIAENAGWAADTSDEDNANYYAIKDDVIGYINSILDNLTEQIKDADQLVKNFK